MPTVIIALRPELNSSLCLKKCPQKTPSVAWSTYQHPKNWGEQLALLIHDSSALKTPSLSTLNGIIHSLNTHLSPLYLNHVEFITTLQRIHALLSGAMRDPLIRFDPSKDGQMLYEKLVEGLQNCTEGFHNRINLIWMSWLAEDNFAERVEKIRQNIVHRVALNLYDEVHAQNSVSRIAANIGLGTLAITPRDPHLGDVCQPLVVSQLLTAFNQDFTPLTIIHGIEEQIYSQLVPLGYGGPKPEGVTFEDYGSWLECFKYLFPNETIDPSTWLILNQADGVPCDVNWTVIRNTIFKTLVHEQFFIGLSPDLPLKDIPFNNKDPQEFKFWAINLADEDSLNTFLDQEASLALKRFKVLHDALPNHHVFKPLLKQKLSQFISTNMDLLFDLYRSSHFGGGGIRWSITILSYLPHEKCVEFVNIPLPLADHKNMLLAVVSLCPIHHIEEFLDFLYKQFSRDELLELYIHQDDIGQTLWNLAARRPVTLTLKLVQLALKQHIPIPMSFISKSFNLNHDQRLLDLLKKNDANSSALLELAIIYRTITNQKPIPIGDFLVEASRHCPHVLPLILVQIKSLDKEQQATCFLQSDENKYNALMLAVRHQPDAVSQLLNAISLIEPVLKLRIIKHVTSDKLNVLMLATTYQSNAVEPILKIMCSLEVEVRQCILQQTSRTHRHNNALMMALRHQPSTARCLIKDLATLPKAGKVAILMQTNEEGENALMLASQHSPSAIEPLLEEIKGLSLDAQSIMVLQNNSDQHHALAIAVNHQPQWADFLLSHLHILAEHIDMKRVFQNMSLEKLISAHQIMTVLTLRGLSNIPLTESALRTFNQRLAPADWYQIVLEQWLPFESTQHKKSLVYQHILGMSKLEQTDVIEKAVNDITPLRTFFGRNLHFFEVNYMNQLETLLCQTKGGLDDYECTTQLNGDPSFLMFFG